MAFIPVQRPQIAPIGPMLGGLQQGQGGWGNPPPVIQQNPSQRFSGPGFGPAPVIPRGPFQVQGSMKKGGKVKKTGLYQLHKGEKVVPLSSLAKAG